MVENEDISIGGKNIIIEVDESKLGKKYNRGHKVEGVWVVGGIERTDERKAFIVPVQDRTKQTLLQVIRKHVKPGSIIYRSVERLCWTVSRWGISTFDSQYFKTIAVCKKH